MSDSEYLTRAEAALAAIERTLDDIEADIEFERSGNVLTLEFENGSKIIVNSQAAMSELWVAARSGGFHYKQKDGLWRNTRDGSELFAALSTMVSAQAGATVVGIELLPRARDDAALARADPRRRVLPRRRTANPLPHHGRGTDVLQPLRRPRAGALAARSHLPDRAGPALCEPV